MATATTKKPPLTVTFDPPDVAEPENVNIGEPTMDDFAKANPTVKVPKGRGTSRAVTKRESVESQLQRLREELNRNASFLGLLVCAKDAWTGQLILMNKDKQIDNWIEVARINPTIRNAMLAAMDMGVYATAITGSVALVIAALAHTQMLPNSDMLLTAVSGAGVSVPSDIQVAQTEAMFSMPNVNGNGNSDS
jgi:hypothetical protein